MLMNEIQIAHILDEARKFAEEEKYLHASQLYERLIHLEPKLVLPYLELASLYANTEHLQWGIQVLLRARQWLPGNADVLFKLGDYCLRNEEYDRALEYFRQIPANKIAHVHYKMGVTYFFQNNLDEAEKEFRIALKIDPNYPRVNESIGELLLKRGSLDEAVKYLRHGITLDPYNGISHFLLGLAYCRLDRWKKAYDEFVLSIDMDPGESLHWQLCGESLMHLRRYNEAEQYLRKSLELDPESIDSQLLLAEIYAMKKEFNRSAEWINKVLTRDPENEKAQEVLASITGTRKHASKI
jgi:tetratricopeptide (TPR) repeat protein